MVPCSAKRRRALTLVEVMIALLIASITSLAFMSSIIFMLKQSTENRRHATALQAVNYYQNLLLASDYENIGLEGLADTAKEKIFEHNSDDKLTIDSDPALTNVSTKLHVWFEIKGFGSVTAATESGLTIDLPSTSPDWVADEWKGAYLEIYEGAGVGQIVLVTSNTTDTLTVTGDLTGATTEKWYVMPDDTSKFVMNDGKRVNILLSWGDGKEYKEIERTVHFPRPRNNK